MAAEYKDKGNDAYKAANYQKAVDFYTSGIEQEPTNPALFSNRSAAYLKLEDYEKARRDADMCIELDKTWAKGWWRKGTAHFEDRDYRAARSTFQEGLNFCPADENLLAGIQKADKYIAALDAVQGPPESHFDPDAPSLRLELPSHQPLSPDPDSTQPSANPSSTKQTTDTSIPVTQEDVFPASPEQEIVRIKSAPNHYAILHVSTDAENAQMKKNYYALARMLHPDKCQLDGAKDAMTSVSQAYDTLTNVVKKTLYDQFLSQTGADAENPNQTYQEWESRQQPVELPKWLAVLLGIRGCGWILAIIIFILLVPLVVLILVIYIIFVIICLPFRLVMRLCFPEKYAQMREQQERERAKMEEEAQDKMFAHV